MDSTEPEILSTLSPLYQANASLPMEVTEFGMLAELMQQHIKMHGQEWKSFHPPVQLFYQHLKVIPHPLHQQS